MLIVPQCERPEGYPTRELPPIRTTTPPPNHTLSVPSTVLQSQSLGNETPLEDGTLDLAFRFTVSSTTQSPQYGPSLRQLMLPRLSAAVCMNDYAFWQVSSLMEHVIRHRTGGALSTGSCTEAHYRPIAQGPYTETHLGTFDIVQNLRRRILLEATKRPIEIPYGLSRPALQTSRLAMLQWRFSLHLFLIVHDYYIAIVSLRLHFKLVLSRSFTQRRQ